MIIRIQITALFLAAGFTFVSAVYGEEKSGYTLLNPTPDRLLRELSADRPDKTESPYTVDAGHVQIEADLFSYTFDCNNSDGDQQTVRTFGVAATNFKIGILNNSDLQLVIPTFTVQRVHDDDAATNETVSGFGDILVRWKTNFWGNDGGSSAFGIMPFVKIPSGKEGLSNRALEGGVIFPYARELPQGWNLGAQTEIDCRKDSVTSGYHAEFVNSITVAHGIVGNLEGYIEFFSSVSTESGSEWIGTVDCGLGYMLGRNVRLDGGVNVGVTPAADDVNPFVGLTVRF